MVSTEVGTVLFPTATFAVFFGVVLAGAWALAPRPALRKCWLIAAGGLFYSYWDTRFVLLLGGMILGNWAFARVIGSCGSQRAKSIWLATGIAADLATLGVFKYYSFFEQSVTDGLARLGLNAHPPLLDLALPLGISFYCFQAISYLIEVRRERIAAARLIDVATWMSFFPTVTSGPITRASEFVPQLADRPDAGSIDSARAFWLIARGLIKKLVIASYLSTAITEKAFADPRSLNSLVLLVAVYAYAVQIYADFSGYTDMAIGLAALLGFKLPENFNLPYTAVSIQDFWSRWHMTLSRWLRDYLFAPLTGRRSDRPARAYAGIVVVMLLAGLWHGAAWGFVVFGGIHGVAMARERWSRQHRRHRGRPPVRRSRARLALDRVTTFHIVCLGWVFFAAQSVGGGVDVLSGIGRNWSKPITLVTPLLLLTVAAVVAAQFLPQGIGRQALDRLRGARLAVQGAAFAAVLTPILAGSDDRPSVHLLPVLT
jgi:alginate O-acetyltransferase complex protein AlgI